MIAMLLCAFCGSKQVPIDFHEAQIKGLTEAERTTLILSSLPQKAPTWQARSKDGHRGVICPDCIVAENTPKPALVPYLASDRCPKCTGGRLDEQHCKGRLCSDPREHLHRKCDRCGFEAITACADTRIETVEVPLDRIWADNIIATAPPTWRLDRGANRSARVIIGGSANGK